MRVGPDYLAVADLKGITSWELGRVKPEKMCQSRNCFFGCEQILQDVIVFNVLAKVRSLSEIVFPQLFIFDRSILRQFLSAIFQ